MLLRRFSWQLSTYVFRFEVRTLPAWRLQFTSILDFIGWKLALQCRWSLPPIHLRLPPGEAALLPCHYYMKNPSRIPRVDNLCHSSHTNASFVPKIAQVRAPHLLVLVRTVSIPFCTNFFCRRLSLGTLCLNYTKSWVPPLLPQARSRTKLETQ